MRNIEMRPLVFIALSLLLSACAGSSAPLAPQPARPVVPPEQRMAAVEAAAGQDDRELSVQPLRDPQVEDLRQTAERARAARDYARAGEALNQALMIVAEDPAVLQERAEIALLQGDYERAETLARRAYGLGSHTGPLCRRHWAVIEQSQLARGGEQNAASARAQMANCTVPGIERY